MLRAPPTDAKQNQGQMDAAGTPVPTTTSWNQNPWEQATSTRPTPGAINPQQMAKDYKALLPDSVYDFETSKGGFAPAQQMQNVKDYLQEWLKDPDNDHDIDIAQKPAVEAFLAKYFPDEGGVQPPPPPASPPSSGKPSSPTSTGGSGPRSRARPPSSRRPRWRMWWRTATPPTW